MTARSLALHLAAATMLVGCAQSTNDDIVPSGPSPSPPTPDASREAAAGGDAGAARADAHDGYAQDASDPKDTSAPPSMDAGGPPPGTDASVAMEAAAADAGDPYNTPPVCTSGVMWTLGNTKSAEMNPGLACDTCHSLGGSASGYEFDVSGTVYPTAHEPDLCNGTPTPSIVITDAMGAVHTLTVNSAGNFYNFDYLGVGAIPTPFKVKVVTSGGSRPMLTALTNGDCNSCHTEQGTQLAPGRVMAP